VFFQCKNLTIICGVYSVAEQYAKSNNIKYTYGGYLSNGLYWEHSFGINLKITGDATYIPGFGPGQAPWTNLNDDIGIIVVDVENLKRVGQYAFWGMNGPVSIQFRTENPLTFEKYALFGMTSGLIINFDGDSGAWSKCTADYGNDSLKQARVICGGDDFTIEPEHVPVESDGITFENFVEEHVVIAESDTLLTGIDTAGFYENAVFKGEVLSAIEVWDVLGDIGKAVSFNFDGYSFQANYYDIYISELILALNNEEKVSSLEWKVGNTYNKYYKIFMNLLKTSDDWNKGYTPKIEKELEDAFKGKTFELSDGAQKFLTMLFNDLYKNHKNAFTVVFEGLDGASKVIDNINNATNIANMFIKAYNSYIVSKAFHEVNSEFFDVLYEAAYSLIYTSWGVYGDDFIKSIDKAKMSQLNDFEVIFDAMFDFTSDAVEFAYGKVIQSAIQKAVYPAVANLLGCAAGSVSAVTFAYNTTYAILNAALGIGKKAEIYKTMNMIAPIEGRLRSIIRTHRKNLLNNQTDARAKKFDMAYNILRQTNIYLYDLAYKYGSLIKDKDEQRITTMYINWWSKVKCHYGDYGSEYNLFSAHCPVDIYIYDANGLLVTSVVNEEVVVFSEDITVSVFNGEKSFAYPSDKDYTVKIVAREEGTMDYSAAVVKDTDIDFEVKSYNIPLAENQEFTVDMPTTEYEATEEDFKLETNDTKIEIDYNSTDRCSDHIFGEWSTGAETKERKCNICGLIEYLTECNHSQYETVMAYSIAPTCKKIGHTIYVCSGCGEQMYDGEDVSVLECEYFVRNYDAICTENAYTKYTCMYCGDYYYEGITEEELKLSAHNYFETTTEATCVSKGKIEYWCNICDYVYNITTETDKEAHKYEQTSVTEPNCTETGYTTYTCTLCGGTKKENEVPAKGHSYKSVVTSPTCTEVGYTAYTCEVCNDSYKANEVPSNGHNYIVSVKAPTCTEDGHTTYTCKVCNDGYTADEVTANGHNYKATVKPPTCTEDGYTTYTCNSCYDSYIDDKVTAEGHKYETVVTPPTCTQKGYTTYTCSCGDSYRDDITETIPHNFRTITTSPSCIKTGSTTYICNCGVIYTEILPATGHNYENGICSSCGDDLIANCSCNCHAGGIKGLIFKIILFFQKLFRMNQICEGCGISHY
jgi:hypothetical protein